MMSVYSRFTPCVALALAMALTAGLATSHAAEKKKGFGQSTKKGKAFVPEPLPTPPPAPDIPRRTGTDAVESAAPYATPPAVAEQLKKFLPRTYAKLSKRQPVHVMVVGDEIANMATQGEANGNQLQAWPVQLVNELAQEFYYTGGVRLIRPNPGKPERLLESFGPEITVRVLTDTGGTMAKAMSLLATFAYEAQPDLVIVSFGINDALAGTDLMDYAKNLHRVVETVRARGADLWIAGPTLLAGDKPENGMALTRALAGIARDEAEESNAAFSDLGDISTLIHFENEMLAPGRILEALQKEYQQFFMLDTAPDPYHPIPLLHQRLGTQAYKAMTVGSKTMPWTLNVSGASFSSADQCAVSGTIVNTTKEELKLTVAPLKLPRWSPKEEPFEITIKPGGKAPLHLTYARTPSARAPAFPAFAGHEPVLRLPLLVAAPGAARIEELRADIQPVAMMWKLDTLFNVEGHFTVDNVVLNTSSADLKGVAWTAGWNGQIKSGTVDIAKGASATLGLSFDLPKGNGPRRVAAPLVLTLKANGVTLQSDRAVEINRNIGLKQETPLTLMGQGPGHVGVTMAADDTSLMFAFDINGRALEAGPDGMAVSAELHIDARSYGKRLMLGSTEAITVAAGTGDGDPKVSGIMPWAFGTGYGMKFDSQAVQAKLSTNLGASTLTISLPRSYLYLHEWARNNGNSQMAINAIVRLASTKEGSAADRTWSLSFNGKHADDVEGSAVLELTDQPTSRWTVVVW